MYKSGNEWALSNSAKKPSAAQIATLNGMKRRSSYDSMGQLKE